MEYEEMEMWRWWKKFTQSITSRIKHRANSKGDRHGLVKLYKDIESHRGYSDIQVMWEMIHSSSPSDAYSKRWFSWRFGFRPT